MNYEQLITLAETLSQIAISNGCTSAVIVLATPDKHRVSFRGSSEGVQALAEKALGYAYGLPGSTLQIGEYVCDANR